MDNNPINNNCQKKSIVIASPLLILLTNYVSAVSFGELVGKWAFIPLILIEWCMFTYFIIKYHQAACLKRWLGRPRKSAVLLVLVLVTGLIPLPVFIRYYHLLSTLQVWLPWIILAVINPWLEEFYWRGLLLDYTNRWNKPAAVLFSSILFAANHAVFGVNSQLLKGPEVMLSTLVMGIVWAVTYQRTGSLKWVIIAHFLVDFFSLSAPSFLDMYTANQFK